MLPWPIRIEKTALGGFSYGVAPAFDALACDAARFASVSRARTRRLNS
jgi:hypothetical protein